MKDHQDVLFVAEGSVRYHRARGNHYSTRARWLTILSFVLGSGAFFGVVADSPILASIASLLVVLANGYRLVAKPDDVARTHQKWCQDWSQILSEAQTTTKPTSVHLKKWISKANALSAECLEDMKAVKAHIYNETMAALGRKGTPYTLTRFQRFTKHFLPHTHSFDDQNLRG